MSVKSGGSRYSRGTTASNRSNSKSPKPNNSHDSVGEPDSPQVAIVETYGEDNTYKYAFTYEKATLYEFKYEKAPYPAEIDPCYRCNRRVKKEDQVNVGVLFHKQCFRCRICGIPLTIQNFQRNDANSGDKEIYCRTHVGKKVAQIRSGEVPPMGLEGPSVGPGKKYILQVTGTSQRPINRNPNQRQLPPSNHPAIGQREWGADTPSPYNLNDTSQWSADQSQSSLDFSRDYRDRAGHYGKGFNYYVPEQMRKPIPHPTSVLKSFQDFDNAGVFEAQPLLEQRHREEEERLLRFLMEEREKELSRLDDMVDSEKDKAAEELLASIENLSVHSIPRNLVDERDRIEEHFMQVKEDRLKKVTEKIGAEEKTRSSKMIDRHCIEMLTLIGEKDREVDRMCIFDHSMKPPMEPPEGKKSSLYKSPEMFARLDAHAVQMANSDFSTMTDLVRELTKYCKTELEKARVLFRWVVAKDANKHSVGDIMRPHAMDRLLKGVKISDNNVPLTAEANIGQPPRPDQKATADDVGCPDNQDHHNTAPIAIDNDQHPRHPQDQKRDNAANILQSSQTAQEATADDVRCFEDEDHHDIAPITIDDDQYPRPSLDQDKNNSAPVALENDEHQGHSQYQDHNKDEDDSVPTTSSSNEAAQTQEGR
ncbi:kyphoscoliosis peptidase [Elysia marginata]|uniref:Kyphoscoliosis peptidase n=1 Tax=Elysia marginata TaxID=1093978 RepID=A0AAV4JA44_9GAST|nr:kyphoscoliosis peptidase [Elysia marginata]